MNFILDYFKLKEKENEFDIILVDIKETEKARSVICVKKNLNQKDFKYMIVSYRQGELEEQLLKTPDYTAHITSFDLWDLKKLCTFVKYEPELKKIPYLWIDAISIDQFNPSKQKETLLKMNLIYKKSSYFLAVPDLHLKCIKKSSPTTDQIFQLIRKHNKQIYKEISSHDTSIIVNNEKKRKEKKKRERERERSIEIGVQEEMNRAYQYLAFLIEDWSNRTWVINEYLMARKKCLQYDEDQDYNTIHYSHSTGDDDDLGQIFLNDGSKSFSYHHVKDDKTFIRFLNTRFEQRSFIDLILNSTTTKNEDRFRAILPFYFQHHHYTKHEKIISSWNITDMVSVRLKLYELLDDDKWNKIRLIYACSHSNLDNVLFPSFSAHYNHNSLKMIEIDNLIYANERYQYALFKNVYDSDELSKIENYLKECNKGSKFIYAENITHIQLNHQHLDYFMTVKPKKYFFHPLKKGYVNKHILSYCSLKEDGGSGDSLYYVFIPFFTFTMPDYQKKIPIAGTGIFLLGNAIQNRWVLIRDVNLMNAFRLENHYSKSYTFKIY
ncbi:unnamed protein product [Cunninghamella blakesleeana]